MNNKDRCYWGLYVILDSQLGGKPHVELAEAAIRGGAKVVQLRDKNASFEELVEVGRKLRDLTREKNVALIMNDNPYLANEIDADGVHVGQSDFPVEIVRDIVGPGKIVGLSTHNKVQVLTASMLPVDYIGVGPVFATSSKESEWPVVGTGLLRWAKQTSSVPVVAIGGITEKSLPEVAGTGVDNFALIGDLMKAKDVEGKTRRLIQVFDANRP